MVTLKKAVEYDIKALCNDIGFKKRKVNYYKSLNNNVFATFGFGTVSHAKKGHIYINITVGVLYKNVEELRKRLTGYDSLAFMQPTIGRQIGYLMPENNYKEWDFVEGRDNSFVLEDMLNVIKKYGFPYQEKMSNFDNLFDAFLKRESGVLNIGRDKYLPILYYLKGEKEKGLAFIEEAIERKRKPIDNDEKELLKKLAGPDGIVIVGSGYGKVDPAYLKFVENYKKLPSTELY